MTNLFTKRLLIVFFIVVGYTSMTAAQEVRSLFTVDESINYRPAPEEYNRSAIQLQQSLHQQAPVVGEVLELPVDGENYRFRVTRVSEYVPGYISFSARDEFNQDRYIVFTYSDTNIAGQISFPSEGIIYQFSNEIETSTHVMSRLRPEMIPIASCGIDEGFLQTHLDNENLLNLSILTEGESQSHQKSIHAPSFHNRSMMATDSNEDIYVDLDLLMIFTPAAISYVNNDPQTGSVGAAASAAMTLSQLAFDNSEVKINLRLVHIHNTTYNADNNSEFSMSIHLSRLRDADDGNLTEIHSVRATHGADLVAMMVDGSTRTAGIAYLLNNYGGNPNIGFSVNSVRSTHRSYTLVHEIGHNMGLGHGRSQEVSPASASGGLFEFGTGWQFTPSQPSSSANPNRPLRNTVMQYATTQTINYPGFSNPDIISEGTPTGSMIGTHAPANASRALNQARFTVSGYLATRSEKPNAQISSNTLNLSIPANQITQVAVPVQNTGASNLLWTAEVDAISSFGKESSPDISNLSLIPESNDVIFESDFESGSGFSLGSHEVQGGFRSFSSARPFQITTSNPASGSGQHLRMANNSSNNGTFNTVETPLFGSGEAGSYEIELDLSVNFNANSQMHVEVLSAQTGTITAGFIVFNNGRVYTRQMGTSGETFVYAPSSHPILQNNQYYRFKMTINPEVNRLNYYLDGNMFHSVNMTSGSSFDWVRFYRRQNSNTDWMDIDNIKVTRNFTGYAWLGFDEFTGVVEPNESDDIKLLIDTRNLLQGDERSGRVVVRSNDHNRQRVNIPINISVTEPTSVDVPSTLPTQTILAQNYPNPFNPTTNIHFQLAKTEDVRLSVYDMTGRSVATLVNETRSAGEYSVQFDASSLSSGVYIYTLQTSSVTLTQKMVLIK